MSGTDPIDVDVAIFGGGAAGLWLLDDLVRAGYRVILLEAHELGSGQTVVSQGIIHGGLKYTLGGLMSSSARTIRDMPTIWRRCLAGEERPDLSATRRRAEFCYLWQTRSLSSRVGMLGARAGLRVAPARLEPNERPPLLRRCPGVVARLDEQVIEPESFAADLAGQHAEHILKVDAAHGVELERGGDTIALVRLIDPESGAPLDLRPASVVLTAGAGNADLRKRAGLPDDTMQRRPLHMLLARGPLDTLNGHCVDGLRTRATITSTRDFADRTVWQIGGQIAEDGVEMERDELLRHGRREFEEVLPGIELSGVEWTSYRVDRAEPQTAGRGRPAEPGVLHEGNIITAWPTKLALVPRLAADIRAFLGPARGFPPPPIDIMRDWPRPTVAAPPWEEDRPWFTDV